MKKIVYILCLLVACSLISIPMQAPESGIRTIVRERLLMDWGWRFSYGNPYNTKKDFNHATGYFSYFTKTGYGDGPASANFDDRAWRILNLPHDWAVEQPFDARGSHSHGYKAIGRNFPEASVGWYRKSFFIPESDLGKRISIEFDGVHRDAVVWVNGFYLGRESSGYSNFQYDVTDYLNYGSDNIVAVRVDVTIEEGWYYEGAGIYRHVWLHKTAPLHVDYHGTFVTSEVNENSADITARTTVINEGTSDAMFKISQTIVDAKGRTIATKELTQLTLESGDTNEFSCLIEVQNPTLWSLETPYLYKLITSIHAKDSVVDRYETPFGIRTIHFDPDEGFFLNGQHVKLKGTNNHQDHAGVGTAIPDALQEFRIARLKEMGSNAYRCSHNPPTPELLDACDRLGMLVIDENRLMGVTPELLDRLKRLILRDRNHPSVIAWSLGNEEWAIEGNVKGARIAATMQAYAKQLDSTRPFTVASSGSWGYGVSTTIEVMGYNYISHGSTDEHHKKFPNQPGMGTEESTTQGTRGIYEDERLNGHMAPTDRNPTGASIETGWKYYTERPYLAGLFYWTGFDYRGESNPLNFPAISSQFGILDMCGFPKDPFYYLKAWWTDEPVLHLMPHWNWQGKEGQEINVWAYSNCDEIELFLNNKSLGQKAMEKNSHLEWQVPYEPGTLLARGYKEGKEILTARAETTGKPAVIELTANRTEIMANDEDVSVITVQVNDSKGRFVPTANQEITFSLDGPGRIIGVGNGDPACHEPDKYIADVCLVRIENLKILTVDGAENRPEVAFDFDDSNWPAFRRDRDEPTYSPEAIIVIRGVFELPEITDEVAVILFSKSLSMEQAIYINGHLVAQKIKREAPNQEYKLKHDILKPGNNVYAIVGPPLVKRHQWEELNSDPGIIQVVTPEGTWKRSVFNGLAQVIVQSTQQPGEIILTAFSQDLSKGVLKLKSRSATLRPAVPAK